MPCMQELTFQTIFLFQPPIPAGIPVLRISRQRIWPIESRERTGYGWYIDFSGDERLDYDKVIENMKACYTERLNNMNTAINGLK